MDLNTRCPQCGTTFSASLAQLQLRKGYIRCINCAHIFDGFESVVPAGELDAIKEQHAAPDAEPVRNVAEPTLSMPSVVRQRAHDNDNAHTVDAAPDLPHSARGPDFTISTGAAANTPVPDDSPVFRVGRSVSVRAEPVMEAPQARTRSSATHPEEHPSEAKPVVYVEPRHTADAFDRAPEPEFMDEDASPFVGIARALWGVLIVAGLVLLFAQLAYVYRSQIANSVPMLRPVLEHVCEPLQCRVAYSRQIEMISIMSSSLRATPGAPAAAKENAGETQAAASSSMSLQVTLRNTLDKPQEWPTLVLDLTDFSGALIVRKNLPPDAYLPAQNLQQPFAASSEIAVSLPIVLEGLQVNGYKVDKFFQ